ncbi:MAG: hypothetical protein KBC46_03265 [Ferrovibrio sp.]|nr:hypothetical protein [Ferrovibrio sp.]
MSIDDESRLGMGGNNPPQEEALREEMERAVASYDTLITRYEEAVARVPAVISNDDEAARLSDFLVQLAKARKAIDDTRARIKAPFLAMAQMVENFFQRRITRIREHDEQLRPRLKRWQDQKAEMARRQREEEARLAREAEARARREREEAERKEREAEAERQRAAAEAERIKREAEAQAARAAKAAEDAKRAAERAAKQQVDAEARAKAEEKAAKAKAAADKRAAEAQKKADEATAAQAQAEAAEVEAEDANRDARLARRRAVTTEGEAHHAQKQVAASIKSARVRGDMGSMATLRQRMAFRITDIDALPRKYLMPDEAAIRAAINEGGVEEIPGVSIFPETNTTVRG